MTVWLYHLQLSCCWMLHWHAVSTCVAISEPLVTLSEIGCSLHHGNYIIQYPLHVGLFPHNFPITTLVSPSQRLIVRTWDFFLYTPCECPAFINIETVCLHMHNYYQVTKSCLSTLFILLSHVPRSPCLKMTLVTNSKILGHLSGTCSSSLRITHTAIKRSC